jgi:hypothetical protein
MASRGERAASLFRESAQGLASDGPRRGVFYEREINPIKAPHDSEGTAGCWARPLVMEIATAFHPQSHGWRRGLLFRGDVGTSGEAWRAGCLPGGGRASEAGPWMGSIVAVEGQSPATPDASPTSRRRPGKRSGAMDGQHRSGRRPVTCDAGCVAHFPAEAGQAKRGHGWPAPRIAAPHDPHRPAERRVLWQPAPVSKNRRFRKGVTIAGPEAAPRGRLPVP